MWIADTYITFYLPVQEIEQNGFIYYFDFIGAC